MAESEIDIKPGSAPWKFWSGAVAIVATLTGGSGTLSYTLAQQATEATAKATAEKTSREIIREEIKPELDKIEDRLLEQRDVGTAISNDLEWIKEHLKEQRQRERNN